MADQPTVMVVDDSSANRRLLGAYLRQIECDVLYAEDGPKALQLVGQQPPDLVLLDVQMPGLDGFEVCRLIRGTPRGRLIPVVMITALGSTADRVNALESGADDFLSKPVERSELVARVRSALRLKALHDSLDDADEVIFALAAAVEAKDAYTEQHTHRVATAARQLGDRMNLSADRLDTLFRGGLVHDIGKIGVPDQVLRKPSKLDRRELSKMRQHPLIGERIVRPLRSGGSLLPIIRHHHENWDGSGYPDGLKGSRIPLLARIVAACDAFDALVSDRPYRPGRSIEDAVSTLLEGAGAQWDPDVIDLLVSEVPEIGGRGAA
jgi:putative two-component system response regulator